MAETTVIREFLVSVGFDVDKSSEGKANDAIKKFTDGIVTMGRAAAAAGVAKYINDAAKSLENLYYQSLRIKASGENIKAFGYAVSQLGGDQEGALSSLESFAKNLRNSPGYYGMLEGLGIRTKDVNGNIRDQVDLITELGQKFAEMPHYQANAYAGSMGIDETTMMAIRDGSLVEQMKKYKEMRQSFGLGEEGSKDGKEMMMQLRESGMILSLLMEKVGVTLIKMVLPPLKWVNQQVELMVKSFKSLDDRTKIVIKILATLAAAIAAVSAVVSFAIPIVKALTYAWRLLNIGFLMSPIGIIIALAAAIALLVEDYLVWQRGGKSLINWGQWSKEINWAIDAINVLIGVLGELGAAVATTFKQKFPETYFNIGEFVNNLAAYLGDEDAKKVQEAYINNPQLKRDAINDKSPVTPNQVARPLPKMPDTPDAPVQQGGQNKSQPGKQVNKSAGWSKNTSSTLFSNIDAAADKYGISPEFMKTMAYIESKGDTNASNPSGAKGVYQFMPGTGKQYGLIKNGVDMRANEAMSVEAAAKLARDNANALKKAGIQPTPWLLYMAHQQGVGGVIALFKAKKTGAMPAWLRNNMDSNGGKGKDAAQFLAMWEKQYNDVNARIFSGGSRPTTNYAAAAQKALPAIQNAPVNQARISAPSAAAPRVTNNNNNQQVVMNQTNNTTINGVNNPKEVGREVSQAQANQNSAMARNLRSAIN